MMERKTLAYGDGKAEKPKRTKKLVFSGVALLLTSGACGPALAISPHRSGSEFSRTEQVQPRPRSQCLPDLEPIRIAPREHRIDTRCRGNREFIITNLNLYIRTRDVEHERIIGSEITLQDHTSITDISNFVSQGIAGWQPTEDSVFILTRSDNRLVRLPNENMGSTVPVYDMPFDTSMITKDRMMYFHGFLFVSSPLGSTFVLDTNQREETSMITLRSTSPNAGFFTRDQRLFFGRSGTEEIEIVMNGPAISDLNLIKRL